MTQLPETDQVKIRRAPKFGAFMVVGGVLGFIATLIVTSLFPTDPAVGLPATIAYFSLYGVSAGVVVGALIALILDRRSSKRAVSVTAEHEEVAAEAEPEPSEAASELVEPAVAEELENDTTANNDTAAGEKPSAS